MGEVYRQETSRHWDFCFVSTLTRKVEYGFSVPHTHHFHHLERILKLPSSKPSFACTYLTCPAYNWIGTRASIPTCIFNYTASNSPTHTPDLLPSPPINNHNDHEHTSKEYLLPAWARTHMLTRLRLSQEVLKQRAEAESERRKEHKGR